MRKTSFSACEVLSPPCRCPPSLLRHRLPPLPPQLPLPRPDHPVLPRMTAFRRFILCNLCTIRNRLPTIRLWQNRKIKTPEPYIQNKKVNETRIGLIYLFCIPGIIPGNICLNLTCTLCYALCFSTTAFGVNTRCSLMNVVKPSSLSSRP